MHRAMQLDGSDRHEEHIREMAQKCSSATDPVSAWGDGPTQRFSYAVNDCYATYPTYTTIAVNICPSIPDGFARRLIAEEIIRKQLGDIQ